MQLIPRIDHKTANGVIIRLFTIFIILLAMATSSTAAELTTIYVQEALFGDEIGWDRAKETVTVGLPLPDSANITDISSLGLTGDTAVGQFKLTGWWPSGNAKWVTVDFQTDLAARQIKEGFTLTTDGSGNFGGSDLATDNASHIIVNTGVAKFLIKKINFNLFDSVEVNGSSLVATGNSGGLQIVDTSGVLFSSVNDSNSSAHIEENGPVKSVIVATGSLINSSEVRFCDYEIRLTFYKNKSYVKGIVSLRNALWADYQKPKDFYSAELLTPLTIGTAKSVLLTNKSSEITRPLGQGETAYVYQGHSAHPLAIPMETSGGIDGWLPPIPKSGSNPWILDPDFFGTKLVIGSETIQALGNENTWTQGYADLSDSTGKGLTIAMKYMPQNYPAGFEMNDNGNVSIELYSKRNNNTICRLGWSKWDSREVLWDFHSSANSKSASFHALQHPLIARAPFEYYRINKAFGTDKLVTTAEEIQYYNEVGETPTDFSDPVPTSNTGAEPWRGYFRVWSRALGGSTNFIDTPAADLLDWVRTGKSGYYVFASQRLFFDAYSGPRRSDDWQFEHNDSYATFKNGDNLSGGSFDNEHHYIQGLPWLYFMTGDTYYKTACTEDAEWNHRLVIFAAEGATMPTTQYFRALSRQAQPLAIYYDFTQTIHEPQSVYADDLAATFTYLIDSRENLENQLPGINYRGRNMNRGYIYWDTTIAPDNQRVIWSFFHTQIHFNAAFESMKFLKKWGYPYDIMDDFEDYLTGLSQFIYKEYIKCEDVVWGGKCGFEYAYRVNQTREEVLASGTASFEIKPYSASRPYLWFYQKTGENLQNVADAAATWSEKNKRQSSDLQEQALYYQHIHNDIMPDVIISPTVVNHGDGSYTLSWIVPYGAVSYQIKYADKKIVTWLGYNRETKSYTYNPSTNIPFFAATNIYGEPEPLEAGKLQEYTINGLDPSRTYYFSIKTTMNASRPSIKKIYIE